MRYVCAYYSIDDSDGYISAVVLCVGYLCVCVFVVGCSVEGVLDDVFR